MLEGRGKLVRDRIPDLFGGKSRNLDPDPYRAALRAKPREEVAEDLESGEVMELADVLEVVYALAALDGVSGRELDGLREQKPAQREAFAER